LRRVLRWMVGLPIVIFVVAFAVANRKWVTLSFNPFTQDVPSLDMPLWLLVFLGIVVGAIVGWIGSWLAQGKHRKAARDARSEVSKLQVELADLRKPREAPRDQDLIPFNGGIL
jgi:uncharacterized integral membrane protein